MTERSRAAAPGATSVTVAVLTRGRPVMLQALLDSWAGIDPPPDCVVRFLVVENDDEPRARDLVTARHPLPAGALDYVLETDPGIPFARNRAAREAIVAGHELLAFVDDDEVVARDWLDRLIAGYRASAPGIAATWIGCRAALAAARREPGGRLRRDGVPLEKRAVRMTSGRFPISGGRQNARPRAVPASTRRTARRSGPRSVRSHAADLLGPA